MLKIMSPQDNPTNPAGNTPQGLSLPPVDPGQASSTSAADNKPANLAPPAHPAAGAAATTDPQSTAASEDVDENGTPLIADDADLIERAWVEKAKQLVDQTKSDPYTQNKEINKFKATYIKKRYNKDIQLSKD